MFLYISTKGFHYNIPPRLREAEVTTQPRMRLRLYVNVCLCVVAWTVLGLGVTYFYTVGSRMYTPNRRRDTLDLVMNTTHTKHNVIGMFQKPTHNSRNSLTNITSSVLNIEHIQQALNDLLFNQDVILEKLKHPAGDRSGSRSAILRDVRENHAESPTAACGKSEHRAQLTQKVKDRAEIYRCPHFNCEQLFKGDKDVIEAATNTAKYLNQSGTSGLTEDFYLSQTKNCPKFLQSRGYFTQSLSEEERNFPIAFSILAFKDIEMFEVLLRAMYRPEHTFCVHIDLKSPAKYYRAVEAIVRCFPNVFLTVKRVGVRYVVINIC